SGCGKSTLARLILGLDAPTGGRIRVEGKDLSSLTRQERARTIQMVLQDPNSSLNPRKTIESILTVPQKVLGIGHRHSRPRTAQERAGNARPRGTAETRLSRNAPRIVRRATPARGDRSRADRSAAHPRLRRADIRPRRLHPVADPQPASAPTEGARPDLHHDL